MLIGDIEGPTARIDRAGMVASLGREWQIGWGVSSSDRWRLAHVEKAVRQTRIDDTPVYETRLRVPGGDVIQRVAATRESGGQALVIDFENESPAAVIVAVVGRAEGLIEASDAEIRLQGAAWIRGSRAAGAVVAVQGDPWPSVCAEPEADPLSVEGADVGAAALYTLPHRQRLAVVVRIVGELPSRAVSPESVATGWRAVTADALHIDLADRALGETWRRLVCDLVLIGGSVDPAEAAEAAWWLDVAGLPGEADRARATVVEAALDHRLTGVGATAGLRALASRELRARERSGLAELAGSLAEAAGGVLDRVTLSLVAQALALHAPRAAADAHRWAAGITMADREPATRVGRGAATVVGKLLDEAVGGEALALLPEVPPSWRGQPADVRGLVTVAGVISFSVRWHGDRPAVLWELAANANANANANARGEAVEISFPGLDPTWRTTESSGEALLAAPSPA